MDKLKPLNLIFLIVFFVSGCQQLDQIVINDVNNIVERIVIIPERKVSLAQKDKVDLSEKTHPSNLKKDEIKKHDQPLKIIPLIPIKPSISITFYKPKIDKPIKPKLKINFNYKEPYHYFNHYNGYNFIPPLIDNYSFIVNPLNLKNLKTSEVYKLFGKPDFIREEANSLTWQYREKVCVLDFFHTKNSGFVTFSDLRSRTYGGNLKIIDCLKSLNQRILLFNSS